MRILLDIGHPAHVHYFRNFIKIMKEKEHLFFIIAKNRNITHELLEYYRIPYIKRKDYPSSLMGKLLNIPITDFFVIRKALRFRPDLMIGFSGTHIAHAGTILRIPSIVFDDTEHAKFAHLSYKPFATNILTPSCFEKNLGAKQIFFNSYMELTYLHQDFFKPSKKIKKLLGLKNSDKFVLFRFISWNASHDIGQSGIPNDIKLELIYLFMERGFKVFISSEGILSDEFISYKIPLSADKMHDILSAADMFIGESGTMATEAAILGTPSVFVNSLDAGVFQEEVNYGVLYSYRNTTDLIKNITSLLDNNDLKKQHLNNREKLLNDKINITNFMVWFIENYPFSVSIIKDNPEYQYNFK